MGALQIVLDTNVLYAAVRSRNGASHRLLSMLPSDRFELNLSVPLLLEYEDVLKRPEPGNPLDGHQVDILLDALCAMANHHAVHFLWRPLLRDPGDDLILELAVRAGCRHIVTFNAADFVGIETFGIEVVTPQAFLKLLENLP